jgi:hypothetical protein
MENENNEDCRDLVGKASFFALGAGSQATILPLPVEGETFFLTFPFIEQAIALRTLPGHFESNRDVMRSAHEKHNESGWR